MQNGSSDTAAPAAPVPTQQSVLNLVSFSLSVGALVFAAMTMATHISVSIPLTVFCLTLSLLGAATKQAYAILGWVGAVLCAVALLLGIMSALSG